MKILSSIITSFASATGMILLLLLLWAQEGAGDDHDGHDHDHRHGDEKGTDTGIPCGCAAAEYGFRIDCNATAAMLDSFQSLKSGGCAADCSTKTCQEAWYLVQAHHDYCHVNKLPGEIEDGFHDFDESCQSCDIARMFMEGQPDCATANCQDQSGNEAYSFLVENGCSLDCSFVECNDAYMTLRVVHDDCDHDVLSTASEEGIHDFEDICNFFCNTPESREDQLSCPGGGNNSGAAKAHGGAFLAGTVAFLVMA